MRILGNFISGQHVDSASQRVAYVYNPATGEQTAHVSLASAEEARNAVKVADQAFHEWSKVTPLKRARILFKFKALVEEHTDDLARLIASEHGKVFSDAKGEVVRGLEVVEFACGIPHLQKGEHSTNVGSGVDSYSMMQPLGFVLAFHRSTFLPWCPCGCFPSHWPAGIHSS